jgi:hypothetical protein
VLLSVLRPQPEEIRGEAYQFDRERLVRIDNLRHDVVHRSGLQPVPEIDDDIAYMEFIGFTFWMLVCLKVPQTFDLALMSEPIPEVST